MQKQNSLVRKLSLENLEARHLLAGLEFEYTRREPRLSAVTDICDCAFGQPPHRVVNGAGVDPSSGLEIAPNGISFDLSVVDGTRNSSISTNSGDISAWSTIAGHANITHDTRNSGDGLETLRIEGRTFLELRYQTDIPRFVLNGPDPELHLVGGFDIRFFTNGVGSIRYDYQVTGQQENFESSPQYNGFRWTYANLWANGSILEQRLRDGLPQGSVTVPIERDDGVGFTRESNSISANFRHDALTHQPSFELRVQIDYVIDIQEFVDIDYSVSDLKWLSVEEGGGVEFQLDVHNPQSLNRDEKIGLFWANSKERLSQYQTPSATVLNPNQGSHKVRVYHQDFVEGMRSAPSPESFLHLVADYEKNIFEPDEENNFVSLKVVPLVVTVVTHGFDPAITSRESFLKPFRDLGDYYRDLPAEDSILHNRSAAYVADWDSTTGFHKAILSLLLSKIYRAEALSANFIEGPVLAAKAESFEALAKLHKDASFKFARSAARRISNDLVCERGLILPPNESNSLQRIQFIGHSRGAALNARISQLLAIGRPLASCDAGKAGGLGNAVYFGSLDGFSLDWPEGGEIGDYYVADAVASEKVNYRVEEALGESLISMATQGTGVIGEGLSRVLHFSEFVTTLRQMELRATHRSEPNWRNLFLLGSPTKSHHLNIVSLFSQNDVENQANYLGRNRMAGLQGEPEGEQSPALLIDFHPPRPSHATIHDGSFELLSTFRQSVADLISEPADVGSPEELLVNAIADDALVDLLWDVVGDVTILDGATGARAKFEVNSGVAQEFATDHRLRAIEFDLEIENADAGELVVELDGIEVFRQDVGQIQSERLSIDVEGISETDTVALAISLLGPVGSTARIRVGNLQALEVHPWKNPLDGNDVNADGKVTTEDLLGSLTDLIVNGSRVLPETAPSNHQYVDVLGDGNATTEDLLELLSTLIADADAAAPEGEAGWIGALDDDDIWKNPEVRFEQVESSVLDSISQRQVRLDSHLATLD